MSEVILLDLYIQPGARKSEVAGYHAERIKIKLRAPATENQANTELLEFLSTKLDLPRKNIEIAYGQTSRQKTIRLSGLTKTDCIAKLLNG